jgi:hypothetical protein
MGHRQLPLSDKCGAAPRSRQAFAMDEQHLHGSGLF